MIIWYRWVTEAISGEPRGDENILGRPMDLGPPRVAPGAPPEVGGKAVSAGPEQAPGTAVHEGEAGVAEPAGEGEEGAGLGPSRRRSLRGGNKPAVRKPGEETAPGRIPTEDERMAVEPAKIAPADRNNRIGALDWEEAMVTWLDFSDQDEAPTTAQKPPNSGLSEEERKE